jgi:hypothetical protein
MVTSPPVSWLFFKARAKRPYLIHTLPLVFAVRGRRLVYTQGIVVLTVLAGSLLIFFNGVTDKLLPLFAIGAFLAFTLSRAGMVIHWSRSRDRSARLSAAVNGTGAIVF